MPVRRFRTEMRALCGRWCLERSRGGASVYPMIEEMDAYGLSEPLTAGHLYIKSKSSLQSV